MDWPIETYLLRGLALSVVASVGGVIVIAIVLVKLPSGYFRDSAAPEPRRNVHPLVRSGAVFLKNLLGSTLVLLGVVMSIPGIPDPGIMLVLHVEYLRSEEEVRASKPRSRSGRVTSAQPAERTPARTTRGSPCPRTGVR